MSSPPAAQSIRCLEHPTLKVPYETLNKRFRSAQKVIDREVSHVNATTIDMEKVLQDGGGPSSTELPGLLSALEERLEGLRQKSAESVSEELAVAQLCRKRIDHLKEGCDPNSPATENAWKKVRLDRMLVEYFLRKGFYDSAIKLAHQSGIYELTNIDLFLVAKEVEESLLTQDISKCLAWCYDNKSKLRKLKSTLEFNVRLQEYIELIRRGHRLEAVRHAKKHLASDDADQLPSIQQAMALLAFPVDTHVQPYRDMLREDRWKQLVEQFRSENYRLFQLSSQSVFTVALQAGLSALKTPHCYSRPVAERNCECPVCQTALNALAEPLPFAHCSQSRLICHISGRPLDENNQPMMLPNGYVYGERALLKMAQENDGQIVCPRTKEIFPFRDAEKVFVM